MESTRDMPEGAGPASRPTTDSVGTTDEKEQQRLLAAIAHGDERAFAELYQRYGPFLFNYLLRLIHDQNLAEDLLQDTFVAAWRGASAFRRQSLVKTWLLSIAHNKAVSWLRGHRTQSLQEDPVLVDDSPGPESLSVINWRNEKLLWALDELSPNHRAVVELAFVHELPYSEIAAIMECPVGTVKSRMSYALRRLQHLLTGVELE